MDGTSGFCSFYIHSSIFDLGVILHNEVKNLGFVVHRENQSEIKLFIKILTI